uniref:DUF4760 domain-containing protein n=1 Tax=Candidatus Kentrum eta TaxID=2126337 RepID=A0A450VA52_9GAMM|nr:MAG: protein of unknown function (DUF4760) [Candidatus Kentron sp. H]VFJ95260.1 MAG: protein of unknown function (DUF4760) [Candidatus Kentron sp. H]VFK01656.1 MAG: protein of unknown function (DUF4760) [Candidatus Kentron sp. H]
MTNFEILFLVITSCSAFIVILQLVVVIKIFKADHERRKKQATIEHIGTLWRDARHKLEKAYGLNVLSEEQIVKIRNDAQLEADVRNLLGALEHMATGLHTGVYDKDLLYRMSATFVIQVYHRLKPYISDEMRKNPSVYIEFSNLAKEFEGKKQEQMIKIANIKHS